MMNPSRRSSRPVARITCPDCGLDQPLSMDCAGCRRSFSLDELSAARQSVPSTAGSTPPSPEVGIYQAPQSSIGFTPQSAQTDGFGDRSVFKDEAAPVALGFSHPQAGDHISREAPFAREAAEGSEPEPVPLGDVYDPTTAVQSHQSSSRYTVSRRADLSAGELVHEAIQCTMVNFLPVVLVTIIVSIPGLLYTFYFFGYSDTFFGAEGAQWGRFFFHFAAMMAVGALCQLLGSAALAHVVGRWLRDETVVLAESVGIALPSLGLLVVLVTVQSIGILFGYLLLILPGIVLSIGWSVSVPAMVLERLGVTQALGRSWELTEGNRVPIFFAFFILGGLSAAVEWVVGMVMRGQGVLAVDLALTTLFTALQAVLLGLIYFKLRAAADGVTIDRVELSPSGR